MVNWTARQTIYNYFDDVEGIIANALTEHSQAVAPMFLEDTGRVEDPFYKLHAFAELQVSVANTKPENIAQVCRFVVRIAGCCGNTYVNS